LCLFKFCTKITYSNRNCLNIYFQFLCDCCKHIRFVIMKHQFQHLQVLCPKLKSSGTKLLQNRALVAALLQKLISCICVFVLLFVWVLLRTGVIIIFLILLYFSLWTMLGWPQITWGRTFDSYSIVCDLSNNESIERLRR
jgi:hypothetical protein